MNVKIIRLDNSLPLPNYETAGACGFDLYTREDKTIEPGEIALLPSNLIVKTPPDFVLLITPRSSLAIKKGLEMPNSVGVIDQDFSGPADEIKIMLRNVGPKPVKVKKGERLAQGIFVPCAKAAFEEVAIINPTSRGGFGSTGGYGDNQQ